MPVKLSLRNQEFEVKAGLSVKRALEQIGLLPEQYLVVREGEMLTEDEILRDGDVVRLVAVISGGS